MHHRLLACLPVILPSLLALGCSRHSATPPPALTPAQFQPPPASASQPDRPADLERGTAQGTYYIIGTVIGEANGTPIYADKILANLETALASRARELDARQFRTFAKTLIARQVQETIRSELEFAAAERYLSEQDEMLAAARAAEWRQRMITESGGSLAVTRRKFLDEQGIDFEEAVKQEQRRLTVRLFYQRKLSPRVQVSADDMRRWYQRNVETQFTEHSSVRFRLIKITPRNTGTRDAALAKITDIYRRVKAGEDFATLAGMFNDNPQWLAAKGDLGWIQKGAFAVEEVEQAVWKLQVGEVSDVIESKSGDAFYLAWLEDRRVGRVRPFEEPAVQDFIHSTLFSQQMQALREKEYMKLLQASVVRPMPNSRAFDQMLEQVADIAMQRYPAWSQAGSNAATNGP